MGLFLRASIPFIWGVLSFSYARLNPLAERTCFSQVESRVLESFAGTLRELQAKLEAMGRRKVKFTGLTQNLQVDPAV